MPATASAPTRILRQRTVVERVGVVATTIWRWEQTGQFPKRVKLGPNSVGWYEHEIDAWLLERRAS